MSGSQPEPGAGFDYTSLPKENHDDYELPDGRGGWAFQGFGRISVFVYILSLVLCIMLIGSQSTASSELATIQGITSLAIGCIPFIFGLIGLFSKVGRWWSLVTMIAGVVLFPWFMAIVFISFSYIVMF